MNKKVKRIKKLVKELKSEYEKKRKSILKRRNQRKKEMIKFMQEHGDIFYFFYDIIA